MFWPVSNAPEQDEIDDIAMLAARRKLVNKPAPSSSVTINNDFSGFAALFEPLMAASSRMSSRTFPPAATASTPPRSPARAARYASPLKPTAMTIPEFCDAFKLSADIADALGAMDLSGPHLLAFSSDSDLDKYLRIGQRLSVRYAESQWKMGLKEA